MLEENEAIRQARLEETEGMEPNARAQALSETEEYLASRVPEQLASRVAVLPALNHVWSCFWELDSTRPITNIPAGMGVSIPVREAIPWDKVRDWLDERGIDDSQERHVFHSLIRLMDGEYRLHQAESMNKATANEGDDDG